MSKTLDCEFKCGSILPPCVFNQLWETPFLFPPPPALALPNEKNITAVRWPKPPKPCFNFYGLKKLEKPKLNLFLKSCCALPFFCMTQPGSASLSQIIAFLGSGGQPDAKRGIKVVSLRVEVSWSKMWVGLHPLSRQPRFPIPRWGCQESALLTLPEESTPSPSASETLLWLLSSFSSMALPFSAAHIPWMGAVGGQGPKGGKWLWVVWRPPSPQEGGARDHWAQGILPASSLTLWIVHPSAHCEDGEAVP